MPKATRSAQCEQCIIENVVLPEEISEREEISSDQEQEDDEVVIQSLQFIQPSTSQMQAMQTNVYAIHRRTKNGLGCE